jgi:hypothetical protein
MVREMLARVSSVSSAFHLPETLLRVTAVWNMHRLENHAGFSFLRTDHAIIIDSVIRYLIILGKNDYSYYVRYYYLYKKVTSFTVPHVYDTVNVYPIRRT